MTLFRALTGLLALATVAGLILLWPGKVESKIGQGIAAKSEAAEIERVEEFACEGAGTQRCRRAVARLQVPPTPAWPPAPVCFRGSASPG